MKLLSEDKDITVARMALTMTTLFQSVTPSLIDSNSIKTFQEALNPENFSIQANSNIQGLITSFLQTEEILRNEVNTCLKVITPKAIEANQKVQEIDGKEKNYRQSKEL